jgi:hypothetical protein
MAVNDDTSRKLTVRQAAFIGVGATVGAGIFSLLAGAAVWLSFLELARQPQEEPQLVGGEVELLEEAPVPEVERHGDPFLWLSTRRVNAPGLVCLICSR